MKHTTTAPMILEALQDEGLTASEHSPYLRVPRGKATEILISAAEASGRSHFDLPVYDTRGFHADEFETGDGGDGATYVYATGISPVKALAVEVRDMAAAVNRAVRGATGSPSAVLVAASLVFYLETAGMERTAEEHRDRLRAIVEHGHLHAGEAGYVLVRESAQATNDLYALKCTLTDLWNAYTATGALGRELKKHGVRPYMLRAALSAVHDRWTSPMPKGGATVDSHSPS
ncbi:hypothetical protein ACFV42_46585 [Streptomyces solisilvae]|uniref:hypothetical protein n=1 Tax=Streptomyces malaysiensis TaxID=92644 RepID=UPI0036B5781B